MNRSDGIVSSKITYTMPVLDPVVVIPANAVLVTNVSVQAKAPGHYKVLRQTDEKFVIDNMMQYGSWMRLL